MSSDFCPICISLGHWLEAHCLTGRPGRSLILVSLRALLTQKLVPKVNAILTICVFAYTGIDSVVYRHRLRIVSRGYSYGIAQGTKYVYIKSTIVYVPSSELGLSQPLSRQRVCPSPQNRWRGANSPAGEGLGESQFRRLEKKLSTLHLLCGSGKKLSH